MGVKSIGWVYIGCWMFESSSVISVAGSSVRFYVSYLTIEPGLCSNFSSPVPDRCQTFATLCALVTDCIGRFIRPAERAGSGKHPSLGHMGSAILAYRFLSVDKLLSLVMSYVYINTLTCAEAVLDHSAIVNSVTDSAVSPRQISAKSGGRVVWVPRVTDGRSLRQLDRCVAAGC